MLRHYMTFYLWLEQYLPAKIMKRLYGHDIAADCVDHVGMRWCADCGLEVDNYGNTEASFKYCCFPDCGCDGARLCMAPSGANYASAALNVERKRRP